MGGGVLRRISLTEFELIRYCEGGQYAKQNYRSVYNSFDGHLELDTLAVTPDFLAIAFNWIRLSP